MTTWGELNSYGLSLRSLGHVEVLVRHNRSFFFLGSKDTIRLGQIIDRPASIGPPQTACIH